MAIGDFSSVGLVAKKIKDSFNLHAQAKEPLDASRSL